MQNRSVNSADGLKTASKFFGSLRLTVVLLLTLAATSIIGTVLPQNESPKAYQQAFGDALFSIFNFLGLFDMYHSWWFRLLILLLAVNIVVCSINRLSVLWKIIFTRHPKFRLDSFRNMKNRVEIKVSRDWETLVPAIDGYLKKKFGYSVRQDDDSGCVFFAEKWRWSRIGVYVVHLSVVLLLAGAVIGSIFGFDAYVNIPEGESTGTVRLIGNGEPLELGFIIRCNDFDVSFYDSGMPKEFRSSLSILDGDREILTRDILVNDPLRFRGINIFQSSYGEMPVSEETQSSQGSFTLSFTSEKSSKTYTIKAVIGQTVQIPEELGTFLLKEFRPSYDFQGNDLGPALIGVLAQKNGARLETVLPANFPTFDRMTQRLNPARSNAVFISLTGIERAAVESGSKRYYTGLQVTKDPGVGIVYAGFILLLAGCAMAFFMSHQQVCVEITYLKKNKTRICVSGKANKGKLGIKRKVDQMMTELESLAAMSAGTGE